MILGVSGHRKLGGSYDFNSVHWYVIQEARKIIADLKPDSIITGAAIGFDTLIAELCIELKIPFIMAVPFVGQEKIWPLRAKDRYARLLNFASKVEVISSGEYAYWKMQKRNEWIVDNSDQMLICFDGKAGGTKNALDYATIKNKPLTIINPNNAPKTA